MRRENIFKVRFEKYFRRPLSFHSGASICCGALTMNSAPGDSSSRPRRRIPRSFKELTPSNHFNPRTFFYEMVWKAWLTPRHGECRRPEFPKLTNGKVAVTWI